MSSQDDFDFIWNEWFLWSSFRSLLYMVLILFMDFELCDHVLQWVLNMISILFETGDSSDPLFQSLLHMILILFKIFDFCDHRL